MLEAIDSMNVLTFGATEGTKDSMRRAIGSMSASTIWPTRRKRKAKPSWQRVWIAGAIESTIAWTEKVTGSRPVWTAVAIGLIVD